VASKPRNSLTLVRVIFIDTQAIPEPDGRIHHNQGSDPESDCGRLLCSTLAMQWYKVCPCCIRAHERAVFCARGIRYQAGDTLLDGRYVHNRWSNFGSVCGRFKLLGLIPDFQQYKIYLGRIIT